MEPQYYDLPFFVKDNGIWMNKVVKSNETPVRLIFIAVTGFDDTVHTPILLCPFKLSKVFQRNCNLTKRFTVFITADNGKESFILNSVCAGNVFRYSCGEVTKLNRVL